MMDIGSTNTTKKKGTIISSSRSYKCWTNQRHLHFLNSIEASFVRTMLQNNKNSPPSNLLRLDRHVPDSSESTQDLPNQRRRTCTSTSDGEETSVRASKKNKSLLSNDQVVPQIEIKRDDEDDKDNGHVHVHAVCT